MSKLTKQQAKSHAHACDLLSKEVLTLKERLFVLENWHEGARHINSAAGAFFTPSGLARDLSLEVAGHRIIDLCAGIGALAFAAHQRSAVFRSETVEITCVEINPDYLEVGRKVLPEANWILADVLDLPASIGRFDCVIANPPFGRIRSQDRSPHYLGAEFEYKAIDVASDLADYGVFLIPQSSAPFRLSGTMCFEERAEEKYLRFKEQTRIDLEPNCGIDTSLYRDKWHGVSVTTEIVLADFTEARSRRLAARRERQPSLFPFPDVLAAQPNQPPPHHAFGRTGVHRWLNGVIGIPQINPTHVSGVDGHCVSSAMPLMHQVSGSQTEVSGPSRHWAVITRTASFAACAADTGLVSKWRSLGVACNHVKPATDAKGLPATARTHQKTLCVEAKHDDNARELSHSDGLHCGAQQHAGEDGMGSATEGRSCRPRR